MDLNAWPIAAAVGLVCGVLSAFGIGGGSLLMVWMTAAAALDQKTAQGINLLYFLPTSVGALIFHIRNRMIRWKAVLPAVLFGCAAAVLSARLAAGMDTSVLQKLFGAYLMIIGFAEVCKKRS